MRTRRLLPLFGCAALTLGAVWYMCGGPARTAHAGQPTISASQGASELSAAEYRYRTAACAHWRECMLKK